MNKKLKIENITYEVMEDYKDGFNKDDLLKRYTDYFEPYDYVLGDYSYGSLRLKGFCDKQNSKYNEKNDIDKKELYLKQYCSYNCRYFILKKVLEN